MNTFVILAAGRGSRIGRVGEALHKALVPLDGKAVISHILDLAPPGARIVIVTGHRAQQIKDYVAVAHPGVPVVFVHVDDWDQPGGGPGASLLAARLFVSGDLVFTSCDTLWEKDHTLWDSPNWAAAAPVPPGTPPERWCRLEAAQPEVLRIIDKRPNGNASLAYTGLAMIAEAQQPSFWHGIEESGLLREERQVTGGLQALVDERNLEVRHIRWTDVGDEEAYRAAVAKRTGYDFTKHGEATYVLPEVGHVVKFTSSPGVVSARAARAKQLMEAAPKILNQTDHMLTYEYTPGTTGYEVVSDEMVQRLLEWADRNLWWPKTPPEEVVRERALAFYHDKTVDRVNMLPQRLRDKCWDALRTVDFDALAAGTVPGVFHGDFNLGNIIVTPRGDFRAIDWREDFAGEREWGDIRYDAGKLLSGMVVHWENAQRGDFRPWKEGQRYAAIVRKFFNHRPDIDIIGALTLINSAPLHASPLDEVLVARGVDWLTEGI